MLRNTTEPGRTFDKFGEAGTYTSVVLNNGNGDTHRNVAADVRRRSV
jgi:uncharacterized repeat protein (TIGR01451 family)